MVVGGRTGGADLVGLVDDGALADHAVGLAGGGLERGGFGYLYGLGHCDV